MVYTYMLLDRIYELFFLSLYAFPPKGALSYEVICIWVYLYVYVYMHMNPPLREPVCGGATS